MLESFWLNTEGRMPIESKADCIPSGDRTRCNEGGGSNGRPSPRSYDRPTGDWNGVQEVEDIMSAARTTCTRI